MIVEKVLGAYQAIGYSSFTELSPAEQAIWYRRAAEEWGITTFEIGLLTGMPLASELVEVFADLRASLVVTLISQWACPAGSGWNRELVQWVPDESQNPAYGLASLDEAARETALLDANAIVEQCVALSKRGIGIRNVIVHTGQRMGEPIPHAIAFHKSLIALNRVVRFALPGTVLAVEPMDTVPTDYPIPFPGAKRSSLNVESIIQVCSAVNRDIDLSPGVGIMFNWGRLVLNGTADEIPLVTELQRILQSDVPLVGAIFSGAMPTPDGWRDSHNCHLDPASGLTAMDARECGAVLQASAQPVFVGMKCSCARGQNQTGFSIDEVMLAQAELLDELANLS